VTLHKLDLQVEPFKMIEEGSKIYELRLFDERRRTIRPFDQIEFVETQSKKKLLVTVESLHIFNNFKQLYDYVDPALMGYKKDQHCSYKDMEKYYPLARQKAHKVVAIKIVLNK